MRDKNCLAAIFAPRQSVSSGPPGFRFNFRTFFGAVLVIFWGALRVLFGCCFAHLPEIKKFVRFGQGDLTEDLLRSLWGI